jgi:four helix bundle protein
MSTEDTAIDTAYSLTLSLHEITANFPEAEKPTLGEQLRKSGVRMATFVTNAFTTDDPVEHQETLRQAGITCISLKILLRVCRDLGHVGRSDYDDLVARVDALSAVIDRERRTVRRKRD